MFNHHEKLKDIEDSIRSIVPFCFKLPYYIPATFHFIKEDSENNIVECLIQYKIKAELNQYENMLAYDYKFLTIFRNPSFSCLATNVLAMKPLTTCFCFPLGLASFEINLLSPCFNINETVTVEMKCLERPKKAKIIEIIARTIYELNIDLPDHKSYRFELETNKVTSNEDKLEFCADIGAKYGDNHGSNESGIMQSCYKIEGTVRLRYGCRFHEVSTSIYFHVNPQNIKTPKLSSSFENIKEFPIVNIILKDSKGEPVASPYRKSNNMS